MYIYIYKYKVAVKSSCCAYLQKIFAYIRHSTYAGLIYCVLQKILSMYIFKINMCKISISIYLSTYLYNM